MVGVAYPSADRIAVTGLSATQKQLSVISANLAAANDPTYSQRNVNVVSNAVGGVTIGVVTTPETRLSDPLRTEDVRLKNTELNLLTVLNNVQGNIQNFLGSPQDQNSLGTQLTNVKTSLQSLADSPELPGNRNDALRLMKQTITSVNNLGNFFQAQRSVSEEGIGSTIGRINSLLAEVDSVNKDIAFASGSGASTANSQDMQDALLQELAGYMDFKILRRENQSVDLYTQNGDSLVNPTGPGTLTFTPSVGIAPTDTPADLGHILVNGNDITSQISGGSIGGYLYARDTIFPNLQAELDAFTVNFRDQMNAIHNRGSSFPGRQTLTGLHSFTNPTTQTIQMTGLVRIAVVDNTTGNRVGNYFDLDLTTAPTTLSNVAAAINNNLNTTQGIGSATITADNQLQISANSANNSIAIVSLGATESVDTTTGLGFSHYFGLNDLLTTQTRFINDGNPIGNTGLSQQLGVRSDIASNSNLISRGTLYSGTDLTQPAIASGDASTIRALVSGFDANLTFASAGELPTRQESIISYANTIWHTAAIDASNAQTDLDTEQKIYDQSNEALLSRTRVNAQGQITTLLNVIALGEALAKVIAAQARINDAIMHIL